MLAADRERRTALIVAFLGLAAIGHAVIFIRGAGDAPALLLAAGRVALATLLFLPFAVRVKRSGLSRPILLATFAAGAMLALHFATWIESVQRLTIAESALLVSLAPLWIALFESIRDRALPPAGLMVGIALCLIGLAIIGWDGLSSARADPMGLALALVGGLASAGYLIIGKSVRAHMSTTQYVTGCYGTAALCLLPILFLTQPANTILSQPLVVWLAILGLGIVSQGLGHTAYNFALGKLAPGLVAILLLGEPIVGSILGVLYLGETVPLLTIVGGVPLMAGIWLALREGLKSS